MKTTRLIAGLASGALLGLSPLVLAAPAHAAGTYQPTATLEIDLPYGYADRIPVGETVDVTLSVKYVDPQYGERSAYDGTANLQMYTAKSGGWVDLGVATSNGYGRFEDIKPDSNAAFRVVYSGYTATSSYQNTLLPAESAVVSLPVTHKFKTNVGKNKSRKGTVIKGKVTPSYTKKKLTILWKKKEGAEYKTLRKIKTDKKGKFQVKLPAPKKTGPKYYFQFVTKGNATYTASSYGIVTSRGFFRPAGS